MTPWIFESAKGMKATDPQGKIDNDPANEINQGSEYPVKEEADAFSVDRLIRCDVCSYALSGARLLQNMCLVNKYKGLV